MSGANVTALNVICGLPPRGGFFAAGSLVAAREVYTATLLPNGKVLVAGGVYGTNTLAIAEQYDPATGLWSATSPRRALATPQHC